VAFFPTLALEEGLQVTSHPSFTTPDQINVLGCHCCYFGDVRIVWFDVGAGASCEETSVGEELEA